MTIRPLHDRILVRPDAAVNKTASGIIIPDSAQEKPVRGTVIAAGPGKFESFATNGGTTMGYVPIAFYVGDTVLYSKYSGTPVDVDGEEMLMMREGDVFGVIVKEVAQ